MGMTLCSLKIKVWKQIVYWSSGSGRAVAGHRLSKFLESVEALPVPRSSVSQGSSSPFSKITLFFFTQAMLLPTIFIFLETSWNGERCGMVTWGNYNFFVIFYNIDSHSFETRCNYVSCEFRDFNADINGRGTEAKNNDMLVLELFWASIKLGVKNLAFEVVDSFNFWYQGLREFPGKCDWKFKFSCISNLITSYTVKWMTDYPLATITPSNMCCSLEFVL